MQKPPNDICGVKLLEWIAEHGWKRWHVRRVERLRGACHGLRRPSWREPFVDWSRRDPALVGSVVLLTACRRARPVCRRQIPRRPAQLASTTRPPPPPPIRCNQLWRPGLVGLTFSTALIDGRRRWTEAIETRCRWRCRRAVVSMSSSRVSTPVRCGARASWSHSLASLHLPTVNSFKQLVGSLV